MGNVACANLACSDGIDSHDEILKEAQKTIHFSGMPAPKTASDYRTKTETSFLRHEIHKNWKSMIDIVEVTAFHVLQAEELLRREREIENHNHEARRPHLMSNSIGPSKSPSMPISSVELANMVNSDETDEPAGRYLSSDDEEEPGREQSYDDDDTVDNDSTQSTISRSELSSLTRRDSGRLTVRSLLLNEHPFCGLFACLEDPDQLEYLQKVKAHASILYLQLPTQYASVFCHDITRLAAETDPIQSIAPKLSISSGLLSNRTTKLGDCDSQIDPQENIPSDSSSAAEPVFEIVPPCRPVRLLAPALSFMDLAMTGSLGLINAAAKRIHSRVKAPDRYIVLLNRRSGIPLAVCAKQASSTPGGKLNVRIYSTSQRGFRQAHAATTRQLGLDWSHNQSLPLYSWADVVMDGSYPNRVTLTVFLATSSDGIFHARPSFKAVHDSLSPAEILVSCWNDKSESYDDCAVISLGRDGSSSTPKEIFWRLAITRGIDPALMLCFAAILDEALAASVQQQHAW